jgi:hypothetical protein
VQEHLDAGDHEPSTSAFDGRLEVLDQTAVAVESCNRSLDDPSSWQQQLEALDRIGASDDLEGPLAEFGESWTEFGDFSRVLTHAMV